MERDSMTLSNAEAASSMLPPATGSASINVGPTERIISTFVGAAAVVYGFRNLKSASGISMLLTGGMLLSRGITGYCSVNNAIGRNSNSATRKASALEINESFTINKPRSEVYAFWRRLENLPRFMSHLLEVKEQDHVNSTWKAELPGGFGSVSWEATIIEDEPGELIRWASKPGSTIDNAGEVRFKESAFGQRTELVVNMSYRLPAGDVGSIAGKLINPMVEKMMREDVLKFKSLMETGSTDISGDLALKTSGTGTLTPGLPNTSTIDADPDMTKPKKSRSRKTPDSTTSGSSFPDSSLKNSPTNDTNQPTEKHL